MSLKSVDSSTAPCRRGATEHRCRHCSRPCGVCGSETSERRSRYPPDIDWSEAIARPSRREDASVVAQLCGSNPSSDARLPSRRSTSRLRVGRRIIWRSLIEHVAAVAGPIVGHLRFAESVNRWHPRLESMKFRNKFGGRALVVTIAHGRGTTRTEPAVRQFRPDPSRELQAHIPFASRCTASRLPVS